jgi:hypothetical protein
MWLWIIVLGLVALLAIAFIAMRGRGRADGGRPDNRP